MRRRPGHRNPSGLRFGGRFRGLGVGLEFGAYGLRLPGAHIPFFFHVMHYSLAGQSLRMERPPKSR